MQKEAIYTNIVKAIEAMNVNNAKVAMGLNDKLTLKEAKTLVTNQPFNNVPIDLKDALAKCQTVRTKKAMIEALNNSIIEGQNTMKTLENEIAKETAKTAKPAKSDTARQDKPAKIELDSDLLDGMAERIRENVKAAMAAHMAAGKDLSDALDHFKAAKKTAKDWLAWASEKCHVKKAQAYALVKVYKTFGNDTAFTSCSMRVLNILQSQSKEVIEECKEIAEKGKLTTNKLTETIVKFNPEKAKPAAKPAAKNDKSNPADNVTETIQASIEETGKSDTARQTKQATSEELTELEQLRKENAELKAQLAEMNDTLKSLESKVSEKPAVVAPMLPQFTSDCAATVLGVKLGAGPAEINKTFRTMAKIFNATTCPDGAKALKDARAELLKPAKKA